MATKSTSDAASHGGKAGSAGGPSAKRAQKVFAGPRVRRLRREQGLTQAAMAEQLGISASYLNLVERNQRPVSAQLLLKLADGFDLDIRELSGDDEARAFAELNEVFADPLFQNAGLSRQDVQDVAAASPSVADAITSLYQAYREQLAGQGLGLGPVAPTEIIADRDKSDHLDVMKFPVEEVRDYIHANAACNEVATIRHCNAARGQLDEVVLVLYEEVAATRNQPQRWCGDAPGNSVLDLRT